MGNGKSQHHMDDTWTSSHSSMYQLYHTCATTLNFCDRTRIGEIFKLSKTIQNLTVLEMIDAPQHNCFAASNISSTNRQQFCFKSVMILLTFDFCLNTRTRFNQILPFVRLCKISQFRK
uniref:Uncharacterized protein n=1 Tax=Cacopsylla melanoneura TaxID=428564 RepID=A0A8D8SBK8_9HEMI